MKLCLNKVRVGLKLHKFDANWIYLVDKMQITNLPNLCIQCIDTHGDDRSLYVLIQICMAG